MAVSVAASTLLEHYYKIPLSFKTDIYNFAYPP